jgi:F-type H+-transporting ATPase subunit b
MELVTPGLGLLFWMLLSFTIVIVILKKAAWKPILKMLKEREDSIDEALHAADLARKEMENMHADNEKIIAEAILERDRLMREAREIKDQIVAEAKKQASLEADKLIKAAMESIENEKAAIMTDVKNQVAALSIDIAEIILRKELSTDQKQKEYIQDLTKDIKLN